MKNIIYDIDDKSTAQERYMEILQFLKDSKIAVIKFKKKNGDLRIMNSTLDSDLMSVEGINQFHKTRTVDWETMPVWDVDKKAWKSFKTMNVTSVSEKQMQWTLAVEEDAETGEYILPFPPDFLESVGWKEGDTLVWDDNEDGSFTLKKK